MQKSRTYWFFSVAILFVCAQFFPKIVVADNVKNQLKLVQNASYIDSTKLFQLGSTLIKESEKKNDHATKALVLIYYANYFVYKGNLTEAETYYRTALNYATKFKATKVARLAEIRMSYLQFEYGNLDQTILELQQILEKAKKEYDYENVAECTNLLGIMQETVSNNKEATRLYLEGLTLAELNNLPYYQAVFYNNLGLLKYVTGQYSAAMQDFQKGLKLSEQEKNERLSSHIQMNIILTMTHLGKISETYGMFSKAIEYDRKNNLPLELSTNYVNFGSALLQNGKGKLALAYYDSAVNVLTNKRMQKQLHAALLGKVNVLIKLGEYKTASNLLVQVKDTISKGGSLETWVNYYDCKYSLSEINHEYENAFNEHMEYSRLKDSLNQTINVKVIEELQLKYKSQKKEIELEREKLRSMALEKINQEERFTKWLVVFFAIVVMIVLYTLIYSNYNRKMREKQKQFSLQLIENVEEERQRISMDLHDDIGQSLSIIKAKVLNEKLRKIPPSAETENELTRVIEQTRELSRTLYPSHIGKIGLIRSVAALLENVQQSLKLECSYDIVEEVDTLPINYKTHIFRILQECVNNTYKHSGAGGLKISIHKNNDQFRLVYQDNGVGLKGKKRGDGIGIFSMQQRAKIMNGELEINDKFQKGFILTLEFKAPQKS